MIGVVTYGGACVPLHRISRQEFFKAWGDFSIPGKLGQIYCA